MAAAGLRPFGQVRAPEAEGERGVFSRDSARRTVEDGMAAVHAHLVLQSLPALSAVRVLWQSEHDGVRVYSDDIRESQQASGTPA